MCIIYKNYFTREVKSIMSGSNSKNNNIKTTKKKKSKLRFKPGSTKRRTLKKSYKEKTLPSEQRTKKKQEFKNYDKEKEKYAKTWSDDVKTVKALGKNEIPTTKEEAIAAIKNYINEILQTIDCLKDYSKKLTKNVPVIPPDAVTQVTNLAEAINKPVTEEPTKREKYTSEGATANILKHPIERLNYIYNGFCENTEQDNLIDNPNEFKKLWKNLLRSIKLFNTKYIGFHKPLIKHKVVVDAFKNDLWPVLQKSGDNIFNALEELSNSPAK